MRFAVYLSDTKYMLHFMCTTDKVKKIESIIQILGNCNLKKMLSLLAFCLCNLAPKYSG